MNTPDITKAQIVATLQAVIAVALAFGLSLTPAQQVAILGLAGIVAGTLHIADAIIRHGRSRALASSSLTAATAARLALAAGALRPTAFETAATAAAVPSPPPAPDVPGVGSIARPPPPAVPPAA